MEPLTRVLAYLAKLCDERGACGEMTSWPIASNALAIHVEARHRCLHLIVFGAGLPVELAVQLNRLRRGVEEFSDRLLAALPKLNDLEPFCFDSPCVNELQDQLKWPVHESSVATYARLMEFSLHKRIAFELDDRTVSPRLNKRTHQAAMGWLPPGMFDGLGITKSPQAWRWQKQGTESSGHPSDPMQTLESPLNWPIVPHRQQSTQNRSSKKRW